MKKPGRQSGKYREIYDPAGATEISQIFAPRLQDLHGKTICELSNGSWEYQRIFPAIRKLLQREFPDMKIIPFDELPAGKDEIVVEDIGKILKARGCQGVIVGNAA